jgi:hypothetical protein
MNRSSFNTPGATRSYQFDQTAGLPAGYIDYGWFLPRKPGSISSANAAVGAAGGTGALAAGRNIAGQADGSSTVDGTGQTVASIQATAAGSCTVEGNVFASLSGAGTAAGVGGASGTITGIGWVQGQAAGVGGGSLVSYATGKIAGEATTVEALSPTGLARSVWEKIIDSGFTAEQVVRLLAAHAAGAASGLESGAPVFKSLDGGKDRITGTYAAGTRTITGRDVT